MQLLKLYGVDVEKLNAIQHETNEAMKEIAESYGDYFRESAEKTVTEHKELLTAKIPAHLARFKCIDPPLETVLNCFTSTLVDPVGDAAHAKAETQCYKEDNYGQLQVELHGMGSGITVTGEAECELVFVYVDSWPQVIVEGDYDIKAHVQANGYHLIQYWSSGCPPASVASSGSLKIFAQMHVSQAGVEWLSSEYTVLDTDLPGPPAAIDVNEVLRVHAHLQAGLDVTIKVKFRIEASLTGAGQIYADLMTSEFFYFKVPEIDVCRHLWWLVAVGFIQRLRNIWQLGGLRVLSSD